MVIFSSALDSVASQLNKHLHQQVVDGTPGTHEMGTAIHVAKNLLLWHTQRVIDRRYQILRGNWVFVGVRSSLVAPAVDEPLFEAPASEHG